MDDLFLMNIFRLPPGLKMSFEHNSVRKNLFLSACFCWNSKLSLRQMGQTLEFDGTIGYGTRTWSFYFVISKYLEYTQYFMMLLEQCGHIVVKDLVTVK